MEKVCFKCSRLLPLPEFYRHPQMVDGHLNKCRDCARRDVQRHRELHREELRAWGRLRYQNGKQPPRRRRDRLEVKRQVEYAIKRGDLVKPTTCSACGYRATAARQIHAHHPDYSKPLEVVWLCQPCHGRAHRMGGTT